MFPMLQLEREEADFALPNFICNSGRAKFAVCHPGVGQWPMNWWTRSIQHLDTTTEISSTFTTLICSLGLKVELIRISESSEGTSVSVYFSFEAFGHTLLYF